MWYVLGEIALLLVLALLLGLFIGWLLWGQRQQVEQSNLSKSKQVNRPDKPVLDLNKAERRSINPMPLPDRVEARQRGKVVKSGYNSGLSNYRRS